MLRNFLQIHVCVCATHCNSSKKVVCIYACTCTCMCLYRSCLPLILLTCRIEPEWYCPIIPMVLVNGCDGIGTGYSTFVPNYNPRQIVDNLRRLMNGLEPMEMVRYQHQHVHVYVGDPLKSWTILKPLNQAEWFRSVPDGFEVGSTASKQVRHLFQLVQIIVDCFKAGPGSFATFVYY